ncbi:MAG: N-acetylmuramoyl-L-alanine amidase [Muribaculaceae bacterium]|nr:N-acetylmuramoyl-L-alanine amidase [Muribaculaceae bacterium]
MKKININTLASGMLLGVAAIAAAPVANAQDAKIEWGNYKIFLDPGHSGTENRGLWGYSEAEKTLAVALNIKDMLETYTTAVDQENIMLCRYDQNTTVSLEERSDMANAWGADFYYSIHSDASGSVNSTLTMFGGWRLNGEDIEKTPNGGKRYGEILNPNLTGVMRITTRGNKHDRCHYDPAPETHENQYPYLSVNRRTTMASLLSEGGYHDMAVQQQRNLNDDYKRLEAFAAFQSILEYFGVERPAQTFMTGMIYNSENDQPLNGAVIKVGDREYTTDTYESLFSKYSRNPDLIHNGFYFFEGLTAGETYPVTISAEGFETVNTTVTIKGGGDSSVDYVTFLDQAMTNTMPAVVASISLEDLDAVNPLAPLTITFSRNMNRESVEKAFSINNNGVVELTWKNDYTLLVDISKLEAWTTYTITIDGDVAFNSQTNTKFDGDGDGTAGGNYTLTFTMDEPDTKGAVVVSTYPDYDGTVIYTHRPPIRLEFDEELSFNTDAHEGCITVTDAEGNNYAGVLSHDVIRGNSVLHFLPLEDLPADKALLVSYTGKVPDLYGNEGEAYHFRFLTEYRTKTDEKMVQPLTNVDGMWTPGGSGTTKGIVNDESTISTLPVGPMSDINSCFGMHYVFDEYAPEETNFIIRDHWPDGQNNYIKDFKGILTMWVYGDGSNNGVNISVRTQNEGSVKHRGDFTPLDFRGWNLFVWDFQNDPIGLISGTKKSFNGETKWCLDAILVNHHFTDEDDDEVPYEEWVGDLGFSTIAFSKWDDSAERKAQITDVELPGKGVAEVAADAAGEVEFFNLQGIRVNNPEGGLYIRRQGDKAAKVIVK